MFLSIHQRKEFKMSFNQIALQNDNLNIFLIEDFNNIDLSGDMDLVNRFTARSTKSSTKICYDAMIKSFNEYCTEKCIVNPFKFSYENSVKLVLCFLARLCEKGLKSASIKVAKAALSYAFLENGFDVSPTNDPRVQKLMASIQKNNSYFPNQKAALSHEDIFEMISQCDLMKNSGYRNRLLLALAYCGGFRSDELVRIQLSNISIFDSIVNNKKIKAMKICLNDSKTGQIEKIVMNIGNVDLINYYYEWLEQSELKEGYLFSRINKGDNIQDLGTYGITKLAATNVIKKYGEMIGKNVNEISIHSTRSGVATDLLVAGADIKSVQNLLGHKSEKMVLRYQRNGNSIKNHPSQKISATI